MSKYTIQDTKGIPKRKPGAGRKLKYPFDKLTPNKEMVITTNEDKQNIATSAYNYAKRKGWSVTVRRTDTGLVVIRTS